MASYFEMQSYAISAGKWRNYPVAITAYAYLFGFIYMGLASLYVFPTGNSKDYKIPPEVSTYTHVYTQYGNAQQMKVTNSLLAFP